MKSMNRMLSLALAALLLCLSCAALADVAPVWIPDSANALELPAYTGEEYATFAGDPFKTGMEGAKATVLWETVNVCGYPLTYVAKVIVTYPAGNEIRKVTANFDNSSSKKLYSYEISYAAEDGGRYNVLYCGDTCTVEEDHNTKPYTFKKVPDQASKDLGGGKYIHHYERNQILSGTYKKDGVTLRSGSDGHIRQWYNWDIYTGTVTRSRQPGLRPVTSFVSPRAN